ncbi:MAG: hypothetical protein ACKORL_11495, partial [Phycisphaerales bacterium]
MSASKAISQMRGSTRLAGRSGGRPERVENVADPFCCQVRWDAVCAAAAANCNGNCGGGCQT